jgi:hypothetical protein
MPFLGRQDRSSGRRRPFSTWMKKLTNFKNGSSSTDGSQHNHLRRDLKNGKKQGSKQNNPYPQSGRILSAHYSQPSMTTTTNYTGIRSNESPDESRASLRSSLDGGHSPTVGDTSLAATVETDHDASHSLGAPSHLTSSVTGTSRTVNMDSRRGGDSTFSSPAPSVGSATTTPTTIQSIGVNGAAIPANPSGHHSNNTNITFSQPFPTTTPASAIPAHLAQHTGSSHPATYTTATANNLLTDNASILTLASSSRRRRRRSFDTDASVRALAPSSLWGGSRESLPLSILSANLDGGSNMPTTPGLHQTTSRMTSGNERNSIYSATGIAPALPSERNSFYAKQSIGGDAASVRSGLGHGRADSVSGSVGGVASPLASPKEIAEKDLVAEKEETPVPDVVVEEETRNSVTAD